MKTVNVVGAVIIDEEKRVLIAQRPFSEISYKSYKWEFPGGKIEENETPQDAMKREIWEELGCKIQVIDRIGEICHEYPDFKLEMNLFLCRLEDGSLPVPVEHNQIKWISPEEIGTLDWLEADYKILPIIQKRLIQP